MGTYAMTGGATGIGAEIRQRLRAAGHTVIVVDLKDADITADLSGPNGRQSAIDGIRDAAGDGIDGLITCAGVASHIPDHELITRLNYFGTVELVQGLVDLLEKKSGAAVLVSSNSAPMCGSAEYVDALLDHDESKAAEIAKTISGHDCYSGSKQAVARWMRRNAPDFARRGVRINAIAPGYTETPMTQAVANDPTYGDAIRQFVDSIPVGRPGQPADIANLVDFLLSDKAAFVCGSLLFVDGGHDAMMRADNI